MGHLYSASRGHLYLAAILCDRGMCVMEYPGVGRVYGISVSGVNVYLGRHAAEYSKRARSRLRCLELMKKNGQFSLM